MAEMKKAGCLASLGQPALATNIPAGHEHPFSSACEYSASRGEQMEQKDLSIQQHRLLRKAPEIEPAPDPNHPVVAYLGPSMARAGTVG